MPELMERCNRVGWRKERVLARVLIAVALSLAVAGAA
jgi:hypothetical protein